MWTVCAILGKKKLKLKFRVKSTEFAATAGDSQEALRHGAVDGLAMPGAEVAGPLGAATAGVHDTAGAAAMSGAEKFPTAPGPAGGGLAVGEVAAPAAAAGDAAPGGALGGLATAGRFAEATAGMPNAKFRRTLGETKAAALGRGGAGGGRLWGRVQRPLPLTEATTVLGATNLELEIGRNSNWDRFRPRMVWFLLLDQRMGGSVTGVFYFSHENSQKIDLLVHVMNTDSSSTRKKYKFFMSEIFNEQCDRLLVFVGDRVLWTVATQTEFPDELGALLDEISDLRTQLRRKQARLTLRPMND